ncbi:MAG: hypothetical protein LBT70_00250 [Holosporaceae bacterium]|jgi:hypothetical protein|nr:hypothetical protein [Holosporaceae bacterium]
MKKMIGCISVVLVALFGLSDVNCATEEEASSQETKVDPVQSARQIMSAALTAAKKKVLDNAPNGPEKNIVKKTLENSDIYCRAYNLLMENIFDFYALCLSVVETSRDEKNQQKVKKILDALTKGLTPQERELLQNRCVDRSCSPESLAPSRTLIPGVPPPLPDDEALPPLPPPPLPDDEALPPLPPPPLPNYEAPLPPLPLPNDEALPPLPPPPNDTTAKSLENVAENAATRVTSRATESAAARMASPRARGLMMR